MFKRAKGHHTEVRKNPDPRPLKIFPHATAEEDCNSIHSGLKQNCTTDKPSPANTFGTTKAYATDGCPQNSVGDKQVSSGKASPSQFSASLTKLNSEVCTGGITLFIQE